MYNNNVIGSWKCFFAYSIVRYVQKVSYIIIIYCFRTYHAYV